MPNDQILYDFQSEGVSWLAAPRDNGYGFKCEAFRGLLGDEMGLGKTAQALATLRDLIKSGKRILFLVPGATIIQWQKQYDRWINDRASREDFDNDDGMGLDGLFAIKGSKQYIPSGVSCIMSHSLLGKVDIVKGLAKRDFDGIVIDEIHKFGSQGTKRIKHLRALINLSENKCSEVRIGLSGTPTRNYANEIFNIANFLDGERFRVYEDFCRKYLTWDRKALYNPRQFHDDFAPYYLRRTVSQVQKDLPPIRRTKLYTEITDPFIRMAYNKQLDLLSNFVNNAQKVDAFSLLGYLVKLRHITGIAKAKEPSIIEPLRDYLEDGRKLVIGIHHHFVSDRLKTSLNEFPHYLIRGGMDGREKENIKNAFINAAPPAICQLSIKAAGEGIDGLQYGARKAVIFERQWNGADEMQFEKRIHRTGQTESCDIEYTIATGTIDEFFDNLVEYKRRITTQVDDEDYESNPGFLKSLAESVIASPLKTPGYNDIRNFEKMVDTSSLTEDL